MISSISIKNFKRFSKFSIKVKAGNILVGPNNSGKSSILDSLRLLNSALKFSKRKTPQVINTKSGYFSGYEIPESVLPFDIANITKDYNDDDAEIIFEHENGAYAHILMHPTRSVRFYIDFAGKRLPTSQKFSEAFPIDLVIVPTLGPLDAEEKLRLPKTVRRNKATRLAASNFRNIWHLEPLEEFKELKNKVERAWPGVTLLAPELVNSNPPVVQMFFEEKRITREIQWAGFGFQIWLQIHTHLNRGDKNSILVIDEPDIYLHPDLQHRLYHDIKEKYSQYFMATHATEIINEADTNEILVVDPKKTTGRRIRTDNDYGAMLEYIGSAENADFAKISKVKKVIFVEGHDAKILRRLAKRVGFETLASEQKAPIFKLGGFSQFNRAKNTVWAFKELLDVKISTACLFDSDYRPSEESKAFISEMESEDSSCYVLDKKEIENYLIIPEAIAKAVNVQMRKKTSAYTEVEEIEIIQTIEKCVAPFKTLVSSQVTSHALRYHRTNGSKKDDSQLIAEAYKKFEEMWEVLEGRLTLCPGKELLKKIVDKIREDYKVSVTVSMIITQMKPEDIALDLRDILKSLDEFIAK